MLEPIYQALLAILFIINSASARAEPPDAQALIERYRREQSPVWVDGDTATFFYRGPADAVDVTFGGDRRALTRLTKSDVWTLQVELPNLDRAVFSYEISPRKKTSPPVKIKPATGVWRGPKSPAAAAECAKLSGTLKEFEIMSQSLGTRRKVVVYLPPNHDSKSACRVVYSTDGQAIAPFARVLEPLIAARRIPPVVIVAVHHAGYAGGPDQKTYDVKKDLRAQEYFPGLNVKRFADHESFFTKEVRSWAEARFGVSRKTEDRVVFGYSNGGRFAVEMGLRHPGLFGQVFGFSVAGNGKFQLIADKNDFPRFYLSAGSWETSFLHCTSELTKYLKERKITVQFRERIGGHDPALWRDEFATALVSAFGKP